MKKFAHLFFVIILLVNSGFGVAENNVYLQEEQVTTVKSETSSSQSIEKQVSSFKDDEDTEARTEESFSIAEKLGAYIISAIKCTFEALLTLLFGLFK